MSDLREIIAAMPKAELHMHIEGSIEPEMTFRLAERHGIRLAYPSVEALRAAYVFDDLKGFLDVYYAGTSVLLAEQDFYDITWAYFERCKAENVTHAEVIFGPQAHTRRGIDFDAMMRGVTRALDDAAAKLGITSRLLYSMQRHLSEEDAFETLERATPWLPRIAAIGLGGVEKGNPPQKFERLFRRVHELGLKAVAHAGEEGPAAYVADSVDLLGVSRVDHGVMCEQDPALMKRLAARRIPLTVCPLSNVKLRVFPRIEDHNIARLLRAGLMVTMNSDDPSYFGGYVTENYIACADALAMTPAEVYRTARNGFEASFIGDAEKTRHVAALDACWRRHGYDPEALASECA